jgi:hypothetical protein
MMMLTIYGVSIDSTRQVGKFVLVAIVALPSYSMRSSDMNPPYIYILMLIDIVNPTYRMRRSTLKYYLGGVYTIMYFVSSLFTCKAELLYIVFMWNFSRTCCYAYITSLSYLFLQAYIYITHGSYGYTINSLSSFSVFQTRWWLWTIWRTLMYGGWWWNCTQKGNKIQSSIYLLLYEQILVYYHGQLLYRIAVLNIVTKSFTSRQF